jgi:serine/threonine protein kinase
MRAMNHDGVVRLYEVYETKTSLCLVIQLIKGKTLQSVLKKSIFQKKLSQAKIYDMMLSILTSLAYVASQGIMHRDLKPGNILIDSNEKLYIGDFGLSTFIKRPKYLFKRCGTPGYMAPEVFCYNEKLSHTFYDDKCDVFSVGCIFYQMLFGSKLFNNKEPDGILKDNKNFDAYSKNVYNIHKEVQNKSSKISKDALKLLLLLLEPEPENRPTAAEALEHPYFDLTNRPLQTPVPTKPDLRSTSSLVIQSPLLKSPGGTTKQNQHFTFNFQEESSNSGSFVIQGANRIVERESLYLDMSRSDNNLKSENNLTSRSAVDSIGDNDKTPVNSHTQGKTTNRTPPATQRKSLKGTPSNRASFLKAAIINNLNKQGGEMNFRDDSDSDDLNPRRHKTDSNFVAGRSSGSHEDHKLHSADESLAYDEIDSENSDIKINLEHLKNNTPRKFPSRESREAHGLTRINANITVKN